MEISTDSLQQGALSKELIAFIGVVLSSLIGAIIAFWVASKKAAIEHIAFEKQFNHQIEKFAEELNAGETALKLDIAYKYAELKSKDADAGSIFINEVSKEMAIGFLYLDDNDQKTKIWVRETANILIGRSYQCDVMFAEDIEVSREHCVINSTQGEVAIVPLNPTNGIILDGKKIDSKQSLDDGSEFYIARNKFVFFRL